MDGRATDGARRWLLPALLALAVGAGVPVFVQLVHHWGEYIPRPDIQSDYLVGTVWALLIWASILVWPVSRQHRRALLALWGAKIFVTLVFMLFYEHYYTVLDFHMYVQQGQAVEIDWRAVGLGRGTENMVALSWLHANFFTPSYHAMKVTFAFLGFLGVYVFYRGAALALGREEIRLLYVLGLFPSILFWSSILGKDPIVLLGIALYCYGVMGWSRHQRWPYLVAIALGIWIAAMIRLWAAPILLAPLVISVPGQMRGVPQKALFVVVSLAALGASVGRFAQAFGMETMQDLYATTSSFGGAWAEGGSGQAVNMQFTGAASMIKFVPFGAFTALFRPLPGEVMNPFGLLAGVESACLLGLLALALKRQRWATLRQPLVVWAVALVVVWSSIYGFVSAQNLGGAVRFKLQILPVLLTLLLYLSRREPPRLAAGRTA
jgi:hypothetical protein